MRAGERTSGSTIGMNEDGRFIADGLMEGHGRLHDNAPSPCRDRGAVVSTGD